MAALPFGAPGDVPLCMMDCSAECRADIGLLVDGEPFMPSPRDPLLVDLVPWIADALVLGHELPRSLKLK